MYHNVLVLGMIRTFRTKSQSPSPMCKVIILPKKLRISWRSGSILAPRAKVPWLEYHTIYFDYFFNSLSEMLFSIFSYVIKSQ